MVTSAFSDSLLKEARCEAEFKLHQCRRKKKSEMQSGPPSVGGLVILKCPGPFATATLAVIITSDE